MFLQHFQTNKNNIFENIYIIFHMKEKKYIAKHAIFIAIKNTGYIINIRQCI
jgi:hypothetical protein